ncbi:MAG: hypothetical protein SGARI_001262 [Bacillariaceae sp.]
MDVDSPEMTETPGGSTEAPVTGAPSPSPTGMPIAPTEAPTDDVSSAPSDAPKEPCESTNGTFGVVSGTPDTDVSINYMYEMETAPGVTQMTIDTVILPALEKAIVDSVLEEAFPNECAGVSTGKRNLRVQRRLAVTGITMNPPDMVNEECEYNYVVVCDSSAISDPANGCSIIDGELTLYTTTGDASSEEDMIQGVVRENMNNGAYNSVSDDIVRLVYLDTMPNPPESNTGENNSGNGGTDETSGRISQLRVGLFVGIFGGVAIIAGVLYRARRNKNADDETDMQTANVGSAIQPDESADEYGVGAISLEDSGGMLSQSYDDNSHNHMADTGMDSVSSDGLGIAA